MLNLVSKAKNWLKKNQISPREFLVVYFGTIPLFLWATERALNTQSVFASYGWFLLAWIFFQSPSLYLAFRLGKTSKYWWLPVAVFGLPAGVSKFGILAIPAMLATLGAAHLIIQYVKSSWAYEVRIFNVMDHVEQLSHSFTRFYGQDPWNEYFVCDACHHGQYDGLPVLKQFGQCATCAGVLELFWSPNRIRTYLQKVTSQPKFTAYGIFSANELVGWLWAYEKEIAEKRTFYIDVVGLHESHRRGSGGTVAKLLVLVRYRARRWLNTRPERKVQGTVLLGELFISAAGGAREHGIPFVSTRTHEDAHNVLASLQYMGFRKVPVPEDTSTGRIYMVLER